MTRPLRGSSLHSSAPHLALWRRWSLRRLDDPVRDVIAAIGVGHALQPDGREHHEMTMDLGLSRPVERRARQLPAHLGTMVRAGHDREQLPPGTEQGLDLSQRGVKVVDVLETTDIDRTIVRAGNEPVFYQP